MEVPLAAGTTVLGTVGLVAFRSVEAGSSGVPLGCVSTALACVFAEGLGRPLSLDAVVSLPAADVAAAVSCVPCRPTA
jgi:hypothetical protein